ncbi:MAG: metal-dependent hydrolase [Rubripirellula sp.]
MTTYEHAMLGINGALTLGLHIRYGWKVVSLAAAAAVMPDWDGLPMFIDMASFEHGHRVWGHNILACTIAAILLGTLDYRLDVSGRIARRITRYGPFRELERYATLRNDWCVGQWLVWVLVAWLSALTQIPADAVVSGGEGLSDWALRPLWPFSQWEWVYPLVPWGNVGVTILFAIGMLSMLKWKDHVQRIAAFTLLAVVGYIAAWGSWVA